MAGPPQMTTYTRKPQQQQANEPTREIAPAPNVLTRAPVSQAMMPSAEAMSDDELSLYVQRLTMRHKRLSQKWWGLRRKHGKDECPYCGMNTGVGSVRSINVTTMSTSEPCLQDRTGVLDYEGRLVRNNEAQTHSYSRWN